MKQVSLTISRLIFFGISLFFLNSAFAHEQDTVKCHFPDGTPVLYPSSSGGFVCGNSASNDLMFAQKYGKAPVGDSVGTECTVLDNHEMSEVLVLFGAKQTGSLPGSATIIAYSVNSVTGAPDTVLGTSFPIPMNNIDTGIAGLTYTRFLMQAPVLIEDSFFLALDFSHSPGDTIGLISTINGDAGGTQLAWVKDSSGNWSSLFDAHFLDSDLGIFPVVGEAGIGILEHSLDLTSSVYPNPASDRLVIEFVLPNAENTIDLAIRDLQGRLVKQQAIQNLHSGHQQLPVDTHTFEAGSYSYSFRSASVHSTGRFMIVR
jgi:hypothetical protein